MTPYPNTYALTNNNTFTVRITSKGPCDGTHRVVHRHQLSAPYCDRKCGTCCITTTQTLWMLKRRVGDVTSKSKRHWRRCDRRLKQSDVTFATAIGQSFLMLKGTLTHTVRSIVAPRQCHCFLRLYTNGWNRSCDVAMRQINPNTPTTVRMPVIAVAVIVRQHCSVLAMIETNQRDRRCQTRHDDIISVMNPMRQHDLVITACLCLAPLIGDGGLVTAAAPRHLTSR